MAETLSIQGFAGIQDLTIELKRINILIGPTASGKSICAKLCFYFKSFIDEILETILEERNWDYFIEKMSSKFEMLFSASAWQSNESKVRYCLDEGFIEITCNLNEKPSLQISEHYQSLFLNQYKIIQIENQELSYPNQTNRKFIQRIRFFGYAKQQFDRESTRAQFFIPAGRSSLANLESNIFNLIAARASLDPFFIQFGQSYENAKNWIRKHGVSPYSRPSLLETLIPKVSAGTYCYINNQDCIKNPDGRTTELSRAASGQQEALPMVMVLESLMDSSSMSGNCTVYIEEPEAHLFPETQRDMVNLISAIFKLSKIDLQFFITTHSPYILGAFNNLLQAGDLYHQNISATEKAELARIVPEEMALSIDDMAVYSLANGQCTDLISAEMGLIDTNIIDEVANVMSIEFGQLLDWVV